MVKTQGIKVLARCIAPSVGLGSYWAWMNLSASNAALFPWLVDGAYPHQLIVSSCVYLAVMVLLAVFGASDWMLCHKKRLGFVAFGLAVGGSFLAVVGQAAYDWLLVLGQVVASAGTALLLVFWGERFCSFEGKMAALSGAGSFVAGCSLYLLLTSPAIEPVLLYLLPMLLVLCGGLLLFGREGAAVSDPMSFVKKDVDSKASLECCGETAPGDNRLSGVVVLFACLVVCVLLNEVVRILATPLVADRFSLVGRLTQMGGLVVACMALVALICSKTAISFDSMSRFLLSLMVAGFLSFLVFDQEGSHLTFVMLGAGYWCLNMLIWIALCDITQRLGIAAIRSFAALYGAMQVAILVAKPLGAALAQLLGKASGLPLIVSCAVFVTVVLAMFLLRDGKAFRANKPSGDNPVFPRKNSAENRSAEGLLQGIAGKYGLSPRETDVFVMLARGRSLPVIKKELGIATGTAQTHVRHIYEKLGIHTRQELLDLVEQEEQAL